MSKLKPIVRKTIAGSFRINITDDQRATLKSELLDFLESNIQREVRTGQQLGIEVAYGVLNDFWYKCNGLHVPGTGAITVRRQTAASIVLLLIKDKRPMMIELKAALLRAL